MQRDLVLRWIEQLGRLVARLVGAGGKAELASARDQVSEATINLLGPLAMLVPRLETESAAELLADPDRIFGYAQLLDLDATISQGLGETAEAADSRRRAVEFARAALSRSQEPRPDWQRWIGERGETATLKIAECRSAIEKGNSCLSRAFVSEDSGGPGPEQRYPLPPRDDPSFDAAAARALIQGANAGDTDGAEEATGYPFGEPKLIPYVLEILETARREKNDRIEQLAERFLTKAGHQE